MLMLNYFFAQYGKRFVRELTDKVRRRIDLSGRAYSHIAESTSRGQSRITQRKHKADAGGFTYTFKKTHRPEDSRLNNTLQFRENAFVSDSSDTGVVVGVNDATYPSPDGRGVTYEDIVSYNDANSPRVNGDIKDPPEIFPMGDEETARGLVEGMQTYQDMQVELEKVIAIQLADSVKDLRIITKIQIGG